MTAPPGEILLVRLSAIGDVVHTLPVAAALKRRGFRVAWIVEPAARPLLEGNPAVTHVVAAPPARAWRLGAVRAAVTELRRTDRDAALDLQGLWKSAAWARLSGARRAIGFAPRWRREPLSGVLLTEQGLLGSEAVHVIDKNLALLRTVGISTLGLREFPLPPTAAMAARVAAALKADSVAENYVILNPGGGWASKLWPPEFFARVALGLRDRGLASVVTWGPGEEKLADRVVAASEGAARRSFPTTLLEFVELARGARLVVAADTGPLHLASAAGAPVVGIFGPTDPARNGPWSAADVTVRRRPLCSPCHRHRCSVHEGVMHAIPPEEVLKAIDRRLGAGAGTPIDVAV
ncbi:MAG TPA: glycosyltransferase family 9 protein [Vicinamibacteria bacterium]|nr:glycosyltransferase family 9 protein [Vicinamibacteria bacterium]